MRKKLKFLDSENVFATYHANAYEPGHNLHVEAEYANLEEAKRLVVWLQEYIRQGGGSGHAG